MKLARLLLVALLGVGAFIQPSFAQESPECSDGADNDGDGNIDYPADTHCTSEQDDTESFEGVRDYFPTIRYNARRNLFLGDVPAEAETCSSYRGVLLKKVRDGADATVGRALTSRSGDWSIRKGDPHGRFYARILRAVKETPDGYVICEGDRTPTIRLP